MGYFYLSAQVFNRSKSSAVAAAAYRSGEKLYSERDGLTKSFRDRSVKPETYILAPDHAPKWALNREILWNEVEKIEQIKNAQLAREIRLALPIQLSNEDQKELLLQFCKENFADKGMVADIAIHRDKANNPHAHIMLTMRPFNEDGSWGNKRKKVEQEVNGVVKKVSLHLTDWNKPETLENWRGNYAQKINEKLKERGIDERVSHESYVKQGLDKVASIRLNRNDYRLEERVKQEAKRQNNEYEPVTFYGKQNQEIRQINQQLQALKAERVVLLSDYRNEREEQKTFDSIRKHATLSDDQKAALTAVSKRAKTYVDYAVARNVLNELEDGNWKRKLDNLHTKLMADKNIINKAYKTYETDPNKVLQYGFIPDLFKDQLKEKIAMIKEQEARYQDELNKYNGMLDKAKTAYDVQSQFTKEEFISLYGSTNEHSLDKMYAAVQHFKTTGKVIPEDQIQQITPDLRKEQLTLVEQTQNMAKSIFILERAIKMQSKERIELLKTRQFDAAFEVSRKIEQYLLQKEKIEQENSGNKEMIRRALEKHYGDSLSHISNTEVLLRLFKRAQNKESDLDLERDLMKLHEQQIDKNNQEKEVTAQPEQIVSQYYSQSITDGLVQALEQLQRANERRKYEKDPTQKKQRLRYRGHDPNGPEM